MSEPLIIIRGIPGGPNLEFSPGQLQDLKSILEVGETELRAIGDSLVGVTDFLDRKRIAEIVGQFVPDRQQRESIGRLIEGLSEHFRLTRQSLTEFVARLETFSKKGDRLTLEELDQLKQRLPLVIRPAIGLELQAKANRLSESPGRRLESVQLICDLRPVFGADKSEVKGMIPLTTLKVMYTDESGLFDSVETVLSARQVTELRELCESAEAKLKTLHVFLRQQRIQVPSTSLTTQPATTE